MNREKATKMVKEFIEFYQPTHIRILYQNGILQVESSQATLYLGKATVEDAEYIAGLIATL